MRAVVLNNVEFHYRDDLYEYAKYGFLCLSSFREGEPNEVVDSLLAFFSSMRMLTETLMEIIGVKLGEKLLFYVPFRFFVPLKILFRKYIRKYCFDWVFAGGELPIVILVEVMQPVVLEKYRFALLENLPSMHVLASSVNGFSNVWIFCEGTRLEDFATSITLATLIFVEHLWQLIVEKISFNYQEYW